jgi:hypothetical protein
MSQVSAIEFKTHTVSVYEPFSDFLQGDDAEKNFEITLLDVVRFAGHACPSVVGAFLIAQRAIKELYPESGVCIRGDVAIELPAGPTAGAFGPMANVFSFITGAWGETGFGGLRGQFVRRGLLTFNSEAAPAGGFCFTRLGNGKSVHVFYDPSRAPVLIDPALPFQTQWRIRIGAILSDPEKCLRVEAVTER